MKPILFILFISFFIASTGCDPAHDLKLQNQTKGKMEVVFYPNLNQERLNNKSVNEIDINGHKAFLLTLDTNESISIGRVSGRYNPSESDLAIDYIEVRFGTDTLKMNGKNALFSALQKVKELDWKIIIKEKI